MQALSHNVNVGKTERLLSIAGGGFLLWNSIVNSRFRSYKLAAASYLLYRGITGNCAGYSLAGRETWREYKNVNLRDTLIIKRSHNSLYHLWRNLENLPNFMKHLVSVKKVYENIYEWKANIPGRPIPLQWKACIIMDIPGEMISWRSLPDALIENSGKIEFRPVGVNTTELHVNISYKPPMGLVGGIVSDFFHEQLEAYIRQDIDAFKNYAEQQMDVPDAIPDYRDLAKDITV